MPVNTFCRYWIEVGDVIGIEFQKAAGIAVAPAVESASFEQENLLGIRLGISCIGHVILRCRWLRRSDKQLIHFKPSFLPAASSAIDSRMRFSRVSGRLAV